MSKTENEPQKPLSHHSVHRKLVLLSYISAFAIGYYILSFNEINTSFVSLLSAGAIFATFGSALSSIGTLIERDLLERIKLNVDILYRDIYKVETPWRRWPFLPRDGRKKLFDNIESRIHVRNIEFPLDVGTHVIKVDLPTVLEDFFDLPLIKNTFNLLRFHKPARTAHIRKPKDIKNKETGLLPFDEFMAYECFRDIWISVFKFRFSRYVIHFGAGLILGSILIVSFNFIYRLA